MTTIPPWLTLTGANGSVTACEFVQGGKRDCLVVGLDNGLVLCWDLATKKVIWQQKERRGNKVQGIKTFSNNKRETLVGIMTRNDMFQVYNLTNVVGKQPKCEFDEQTTANGKEEEEEEEMIVFPAMEFEMKMRSLSFCPLVCTRVWDRTYCFGYASSENEFATMLGGEWKIQTVKNEPCGMVMTAEMLSIQKSGNTFVFVGYESGHVSLFEIVNKGLLIEPKKVLEMKVSEGPVVSLGYSTTKNTLIVGAADNKLRIFKNKGESEEEFDFGLVKEIETEDVMVSQISVREGAACNFASAFGDNITRVYSHKGRLLAHLEGHADSVVSICHSKPLHHVSLSVIETRTHIPGILLATGSKDCTVCLWSLYNDNFLG
eukprot:m.11930 g.11930  ORF g.11930 m.11930 type:complete len:375 (-) comp3923_c0_seq1:104-1228(-)